jgi:hypothetical protein
MFKFKKREKEDRIKHMELKENRTEEVGVFSRFIRVIINIVKDASITLKSALGLKGRKTGDGDGSAEN